VNKTLGHQIANCLNTDPATLPKSFQTFIEAISKTYDQLENDRKAVEIAMSALCKRQNDLTNQFQKSLQASDKTNLELISFFEKIEHVYFSVDMLKPCINYISPACEKVYGYSSETFYQNNNLWVEVIRPEDMEIVKNTFAILRKGQTFNPQYRIKHGDNSIRWLETKLTPTINDEGLITKLDGITIDITQRKLTEEALKTNNEELKKSNYELDAFVYSVSHDLRAPLTSVLGILEITKEETGNRFVLDHLDLIKESIHKLDDFIKDIMENSNNSNLDVKSERINFKEMLAQIVDTSNSKIGLNKAVKIKIDINDKNTFYSDKFRINTLLNNLIENAIQYQNPHEKDPIVDIKIDMSDTETNIIVRDNGIGISDKKIENIFNIFYRGTTKSTGAGLGLYVVKEIIAKLNGAIKVESEIGKGTEFKMNIPNRVVYSTANKFPVK